MVNKTIYRKHEPYFNLSVFRKVPSSGCTSDTSRVTVKRHIETQMYIEF